MGELLFIVIHRGVTRVAFHSIPAKFDLRWDDKGWRITSPVFNLISILRNAMKTVLVFHVIGVCFVLESAERMLCLTAFPSLLPEQIRRYTDLF